MAKLNFQQGLANSAQILRGLLLGQAEGLETETAQRLKKEKQEAEAAYRQAILEGNAENRDLQKQRISIAERALLRNAAEEEEKKNKERLAADADKASRLYFSGKLGIPFESTVPGSAKDLQATYLSQAAPEKPQRLTPNQKLLQARAMRDSELKPLLEERKRLAFALKGPNLFGLQPSLEPVLTSEDLDKLYRKKADDPSFLQNFTAYNELNGKIAKIKDDPKSLEKYLERVRAQSDQPLDEEIEETEAFIQNEAVAVEDGNSPRRKLLEEKIDSGNFTENELLEYENLIGVE